MPAEMSGRCVGGPLDGKTVTVKTADGFLAADKANNRAWIYKPTGNGTFVVCVDHDNTLIYPDGPKTGERRLDWDRMPLSNDSLPVVSLGNAPEAYAGDPVDDGW